jgi:hypothetical protein
MKTQIRTHEGRVALVTGAGAVEQLTSSRKRTPNLLQLFEHEHSGSGIHLCMSQAITKHRSVLAIPMNAS